MDICLLEKSTGRTYKLTGDRYNIGRNLDNNIILKSSRASRYHAYLESDGEHFNIYDLNSSNGLHINSKQISRAVLQDGDEITLGNDIFIYCSSERTKTVMPICLTFLDDFPLPEEAREKIIEITPNNFILIWL